MQMELGENPIIQSDVALRQHYYGKSTQKSVQAYANVSEDLVPIACRHQLKAKESAIERSVKDWGASVGLEAQVLG